MPLTSRTTLRLSLALWLLSLVLPAVIDRSGIYFGWMILLVGIFAGFPWFANIGIWLTRLSIKRESDWVLLWLPLTTALSLTTFLVTMYPRDEGGSRVLVFGYGAGALLWFCAIALLWVAAGQKRRESIGGPDSISRLLTGVGAVALGLLVIGTVVKGVLDRTRANTADRRHLAITNFENGSALVKRTSVCALEPYTVAGNPGRLDGVVEIADPFDDYFRIWSESPLDVLAWGVRTVRLDGADFTLRERATLPYVEARSAAGSPDVRVRLTAGALASNRELQLRIEDVRSNNVTSFLWQQQGDVHGGSNWLYETCPPIPEGAGTARALLADALGVTAGRRLEIGSVLAPTRARFSGPFTAVSQATLSTAMPRPAECPGDVHVVQDFFAPVLRDRGHATVIGTPWRIGDIVRFIPGGGSAIHCGPTAGYSVTWGPNGPTAQEDADFGLLVVKLSLTDGVIEGSRFVPTAPFFPRMSGKRHRVVEVLDVAEDREDLYIRISVQVWQAPSEEMILRIAMPRGSGP